MPLRKVLLRILWSFYDLYQDYTKYERYLHIERLDVTKEGGTS